MGSNDGEEMRDGRRNVRVDALLQVELVDYRVWIVNFLCNKPLLSK